ncbi:MAG: ATP-binding protein [Myxococcaceae bacterium]|jgi:signal transduction histidine kinase/CheY-like chemotaxis protein|nr:ATP-binding protein [Myxococcaceae bacterium]
MHVLLISQSTEPLELPPGASLTTGTPSPWVVVVRGRPCFASLATAWTWQRDGALVLGVDVPEPPVGFEYDAVASASELPGAIVRLGRLYELEQASIQQLSLWEGAYRGSSTSLYSAIQRRLGQQASVARQKDLVVEAELQLLGEAIDGLDEPLCVVDAGGEVYLANRACSLDRSGPLRLQDVFRAQAGDSLEACLVRAAGGERVRTSLVRRVDGVEREYSAVFARSRTASERGVLVVGAFQDVTEQTRLTQRAARFEALSSTGRLMAGVIHELNNQLTSVLNVLMVLKDRVEPSSPTSQLLAVAQDGCDRMAQVVGDLRAPMATASVQEAVDAHEVVEAALRTASHVLKHRGHVSLELLDAPPLFADARRLGQVVLNLVLNAAECLDPLTVDSNRVVVRVSTTAQGWGRIEVIDNGPGMSAATLAHAFDPFFSTKATGSGLGLALCREFVEAQGGRIDLESAVGAGTRVTVDMPPAPAPPVQRVSVPSPLPSRELGPVLIVDDEANLRASLSWVLGEVPTICVATVEAARAAIATQSVAAVLCDFQMPTGLGTELLGWLRSSGSPLADRFALLTGGALDERQRVLLERASVPVLEKPFSRAQVLALLGRFAATRAA